MYQILEHKNSNFYKEYAGCGLDFFVTPIGEGIAHVQI
jgi:hypothetical protein